MARQLVDNVFKRRFRKFKKPICPGKFSLQITFSEDRNIGLLSQDRNGCQLCWSQRLPRFYDNTFKWWYSGDENSFFSAPPAVTSDGLYIGDSMGRLLARDPVNPSKEIWTFQTTSRITATPLVLGDVVYFGTTNGIVHALDRHSGNEIWSLDLESPITLPITYGSEKLLVRTDDGNLIAIH